MFYCSFQHNSTGYGEEYQGITGLDMLKMMFYDLGCTEWKKITSESNEASNDELKMVKLYFP